MSSGMIMQQGSPAGNRAASPDKGDHAGVCLRRLAGGPALLAVTGLVALTGFWWFTIWFLLAGRIS
ncbi:MAG: hypothetical protein ACLQB1_14050 [Streptosporangiaceae bacterium]